MLNFITLFDKNYLSRGIALYYSLIKHSNDFFLFILAMDDETGNFLLKNNFNKTKIILLNQIEEFYPELFSIKESRTRAEYCWTMTPYCIQYAIKKFNLNSCTYLDADILFYNNPELLLEEAGEKSILITEHRYTPEYDQIKTSGKYCVQFVYFKNDTDGLFALEWWRQRCQEWCYARIENNKFGDQKYLDDWISRFKNVYVPIHIGCGVAPWNIQQYDLDIENNTIFVQDKITKERGPLVFFHFHNLKKCFEESGNMAWYLGGYDIYETVKEILYKEYIHTLIEIEHNNNITNIILNEKQNIPKPSTLSIILIVLKNIVKSFFLVKNYKYFKNYEVETYNKTKNRFLKIYL